MKGRRSFQQDLYRFGCLYGRNHTRGEGKNTRMVGCAGISFFKTRIKPGQGIITGQNCSNLSEPAFDGTVDQRNPQLTTYTLEYQSGWDVIQPVQYNIMSGKDLGCIGRCEGYFTGPDHVTLQALITWLIKSRSRD